VRHIIFPGLRLLVWSVIAVALGVMAFGGSGNAARDDPLRPSVAVGQPTVMVAPGDVASTIELTGTVATDPAATVMSTAVGPGPPR
jgi:multidrug efflux pump subunit AcrA (membrane-fusion protein)